jgi:hypothetical protein
MPRGEADEGAMTTGGLTIVLRLAASIARSIVDTATSWVKGRAVTTRMFLVSGLLLLAGALARHLDLAIAGALQSLGVAALLLSAMCLIFAMTLFGRR